MARFRKNDFFKWTHETNMKTTKSTIQMKAFKNHNSSVVHGYIIISHGTANNFNFRIGQHQVESRE